MKNNQKVIASVLLLLVVAVGGYFFLSKKADDVIIFPQSENDNWKTYDDNKYGFEFEYPSNFEVFKDNTGKIHIIHPEDKNVDLEGKEPVGGVWITVVDNKNKLSLMDWWKKEGPYTTKASHDMGVKPDTFPIEQMIVDGVEGIYIGGTEGFLTNTLVLPYGDKMVEMNLMAEESMAILSTFKLTKPVVRLDASTWKTYTNSEYGFSLKFPYAWKDYRASKNADAFGVFDFGLKEDRIFSILVMTEDQWITANKAEGVYDGGELLGRQNGYVFSWGGPQACTDVMCPLITKDLPAIKSTFKFTN